MTLRHHMVRLTFTAALFVACAAPNQSGPPAMSQTPAPTPAPPSAPPQPPAESQPASTSSVSAAHFGTVDGQEVSLYTLRNAKGLVLKVTNYGAAIIELDLPDRNGKMADVVGGFESFEPYTLATNPHFGGIVGRVANRIKHAEFELDGKKYKLADNDHGNSLHGGNKGFDRVVWSAQPSQSAGGVAIQLNYSSKSGEENYPGKLDVTVTYTLSNENELRIEMKASTDQTTIVNLAQHTYWNLAGVGSGTIRNHELTLYADQYTPGDPVPNGTTKGVTGTPFDFTTAKLIGKDLDATGGKPIGYDHNYVVRGTPYQLRPVAKVKEPTSGRVMTLSADQPGVQFYTGNFMDGTLKGKATTYQQYAMLCLETQRFPNAINVPAWRDQVILKPGQPYTHTMVESFTTE
jgi:aldose 1-epimerase